MPTVTSPYEPGDRTRVAPSATATVVLPAENDGGPGSVVSCSGVANANGPPPRTTAPLCLANVFAKTRPTVVPLASFTRSPTRSSVSPNDEPFATRRLPPPARAAALPPITAALDPMRTRLSPTIA